MFLATTGLTEAWNPDDEVMVLHRGCLRADREAQWRARRLQVAPNPWEDVEVTERAKDYCRETYEYLLPKVASVINRLHGRREPVAYWRIVLGPWLLHYVHVVYERYCSLRAAEQVGAGLRTRVLGESARITPTDTRAFLDLAAWSDVFNLEIYSHLLQHAGFSDIACEELPPDLEADRKSVV